MKTVTITRKISDTFAEEAQHAHIKFDVYDLVPITYLDAFPLQITLNNNFHPFVFTSMHAVKAVMHLCKLHSIPLQHMNAFCISGNTLNTAKEHGFKILASARTGQLLAETIREYGATDVLHCTANIRRDELYTYLSKYGIHIQSCEVYHKTKVPQKVNVKDAILFYSPSQVDTFFSSNTLEKNIPAFCIGNTTAIQLSNYLHPLIIVSSSSTDQEMLDAVTTYFKQHI